MELRHLRYFVAVAEELHFGRAAERLYIAQPALSKQINQLEEELGVQLLQRTKRRVWLTEAGRVFLDDARETLRQAGRAVDTAKRAARGEIGKLRVGFVAPATLSILPPVIGILRERFPDLEFRLRELTTAEQVEALYERSIQVGFVRELTYYDDDALDLKPALREPLIVALPEAHPLAALEQVPIASLADEPYILLSRHLEPGLCEKYLSILRDSGFSPKIEQEATHIEAMLGLVAEGLGLSLAPASLRGLERNGVVYRELQEASPEIEMAVAWRRDDTSPVLKTFLEIVEEVAHPLLPKP